MENVFYYPAKAARQQTNINHSLHGIWEAYKRMDFKTILISADLWIPDGIAPVLLARLPRANPMQAFFDPADHKGYSSFFYGDIEAILAQLKEIIQRKYSNHRIAGIFSPPFKPLTEYKSEEIINMINHIKPDVLWIALALPKQNR